MFENLPQMLLSKPLQPIRPQQEILGLIGTGDGRAIASRGNWGCGPSKLLWVWKDYIDRIDLYCFIVFPERLPKGVLTLMLARSTESIFYHFLGFCCWDFIANRLTFYLF
ncbi:MAG: hypothetical protein GDA43_16855 [Hormoscilla sp. SP5CHS1]|nr:hypothetical protein [Hormoscilla sp. SP5CHS1]